MIIAGDYDYSDPKIQQEVEKLTQTFENTSYVTNSLYTESWLRSFLQYIDRNVDYLNISIKTEKDFMDALEDVSSRITNFFILTVLFMTN